MDRKALDGIIFKKFLKKIRIALHFSLNLGIIKKIRDMTKEREFKVDITLAADFALFLEALLEAEFNEEFDAEEAMTDTFLDQFMPNGFVPNADLIKALLASGIVKKV